MNAFIAAKNPSYGMGTLISKTMEKKEKESSMNATVKIVVLGLLIG